MNYQPLRDVITVTVPEGEQTTASGFVIAGTKKTHTRGVISASGPEAQELGLVPGTDVIFVGNILREDTDKETKTLWMTSDNVIGIVRN